jgi:hypothetical protein
MSTLSPSTKQIRSSILLWLKQKQFEKLSRFACASTALLSRTCHQVPLLIVWFSRPPSQDAATSRDAVMWRMLLRFILNRRLCDRQPSGGLDCPLEIFAVESVHLLSTVGPSKQTDASFEGREADWTLLLSGHIATGPEKLRR